MIRFTIPHPTAERLMRLPLASADEQGLLRHVALRCTPTAVRFATTNGRMLATMLIPIDQVEGDPADLILDADQFSAALKAASKASGGGILVEIGPKEARISRGIASAIVRRLEGTYPLIDHAWTRPAGLRWVPTTSSLDHNLVAIAQKISGNRHPLLFASPIQPAAGIERLWAVAGATPDASLPMDAMRAAVTAPAYWADHELAFLIMPITRGDNERQLDLAAFSCPAPAASLAA